MTTLKTSDFRKAGKMAAQECSHPFWARERVRQMLRDAAPAKAAACEQAFWAAYDAEKFF